METLRRTIFPFSSLSTGFKSFYEFASFLNTISTEVTFTSLLCFAHRIIYILQRLISSSLGHFSQCRHANCHGHRAVTWTKCVMWWSNKVLHTLSDLHTITLTNKKFGGKNQYKGNQHENRRNNWTEQKDSLMVGCLCLIAAGAP